MKEGEGLKELLGTVKRMGIRELSLLTWLQGAEDSRQ